MDKVADILDVARSLSRDERRRLVIALDSVEAEEEASEDLETPRSYAGLRRLVGAFHTDFTDISSNKYEHVAASIAEHKAR